MSPSSILENILASAQILTLGTTVGSSITPFVSHRFLSATVFFFFFFVWIFLFCLGVGNCLVPLFCYMRGNFSMSLMTQANKEIEAGITLKVQ